MSGRSHGCEGCGNGGLNNDLPCSCPDRCEVDRLSDYQECSVYLTGPERQELQEEINASRARALRRLTDPANKGKVGT